MPSSDVQPPPGSRPDKRKRKQKRTTKTASTSARRIVKTKKFIAQVEQAVEFRLLGYSFAQIGKEMGFDQSYAYRLVNWAMQQVPSEGVDQLRALQTNRLEAMLSGIMDKAIGGDGEAADQCLRIMEMFNKLHGLHAAQKLEHSGEVQGGGNPVFIISEADARL